MGGRAARDLAARAHPLPCFHLPRVAAPALVDHLDLGALEGALVEHVRRASGVGGRRLEGKAVRAAGQRTRVLDGVGRVVAARGGLARERDGGGEDAAAALLGLHGAGGEGAAVADQLDVEEDGQIGLARQEEVAVARVGKEISGHGALRRRDAHGDDGAAIDAAGSGGLPGRAGVGEDVLGGGG